MEKLKPTYDLDAFKTAFSTVEQLRATSTALKGAAALGFGREDIIDVVQSLERRDFYKSMTSTLTTASGKMSVMPDRTPA